MRGRKTKRTGRDVLISSPGRAGLRGQNLLQVQRKPPGDFDLFQFAKLPQAALCVEHACKGHL